MALPDAAPSKTKTTVAPPSISIIPGTPEPTESLKPGPCPTPSCPPKSRTCTPACEAGFVCQINVIRSNCECPLAKCAKIDFDTGEPQAEPSPPSVGPSTKPSVVGPVVGSLAGVVVITLVAFYYLCHRRRRRRTNTETRLDLGSAPTDLDKAMKVPNATRIDHAPGSPPGNEPLLLPGLSDLGGGPQASFMGLLDENHNKHDSIASTMSTGILEEAIVMAVASKATPQVIQLDSVRTNNAGLIQRSNSLHTSNSIKRSKSQRRLMEANKTGRIRTQQNLSRQKYLGSPLSASDKGDDHNEGDDTLTEDVVRKDKEDSPATTPIQYTPAVMITGPSARSSAQSTSSISRPLNLPSMVLEPRPILINSALRPSSSASGPLLPPPTSIPSTVPASSSTITPISPASSLPESGFPPSPQNLRTGTAGTRNSTVSTFSDTRSSSRGDGEEIMIFWDGHRDSKVARP